MKTTIARTVAGLLTSTRVRGLRRSAFALGRRLRGGTAVVSCFHQADDPYSHLVLQALPALISRYRIELQPHVVLPPDDTVAPDRPRLLEWSRRDAVDLATATGLEFPDPGHQPDPALTSLAERVLANLFASRRVDEMTLTGALTVSDALWRGDRTRIAELAAAPESKTRESLETGTRLRARLGHYLGATLHFEGEWYWGVDRLQCLEQRLREAGLARDARDAAVVTIPVVECRHRPANGHRPRLEFYCSLRSPYTYVAVPRVRRLADRYGADLHLRFVLPMVMRGLPVPLEKRLYILRDTKREAERLGLPFGRIVDPVGVPTERGLAVLHHAISAGKGPEFLESFMRGAWADGIDAGSDDGLQQIAGRVGLDEAFVNAALADASWREVAAANRERMLALGLWGVPSFSVDDAPARWGQDRLWRVERDLIAATQAVPINAA